MKKFDTIAEETLNEGSPVNTFKHNIRKEITDVLTRDRSINAIFDKLNKDGHYNVEADEMRDDFLRRLTDNVLEIAEELFD